MHTFVMFEWPGREGSWNTHSQPGADVLYMDGRVERMKLIEAEALTVEVIRGRSPWDSYNYPANDPFNARQPVNTPMANFIAPLRGES